MCVCVGLSGGTCVLGKPISSILQGKSEAVVNGWMDGKTDGTPLTKLLNLSFAERSLDTQFYPPAQKPTSGHPFRLRDRDRALHGK